VMRFNTAISAMMILTTEMESAFAQGFGVTKEDFKKFLQILAPFAPHVAEEIWNLLGEKKSISFSKWPVWDKNLIKDDEVKIAVQINGKTRAEIIIEADENEEEVKAIALKEKNIISWVQNKEIKKEKEEVLELTKNVHQLELENEKQKNNKNAEPQDKNAL